MYMMSKRKEMHIQINLKGSYCVLRPFLDSNDDEAHKPEKVHRNAHKQALFLISIFVVLVRLVFLLVLWQAMR
eukprot:m.20376 g.20376  ORF g.20376 m.20376 type:complete len:73 (+) comp8864_c0_seq1:400-618(+)